MNDKTLVERLRQTESSGADIAGIKTIWYRNPEGPEAADTIEAQAEEKKALQSRIETLEAALGWYADKDNWRTKGHPQIDWNDKPILRDQGRRAKQALEGEQHVD